MITGIIITVTAFIYVCYLWKGKREIVLEISKNLDYPSRVEELLKIFEERKKWQIDYRRSEVITIFAGARLYLLGFLAYKKYFRRWWGFTKFYRNWTMIAGYLYPNTGEELSIAIEEYEKK